MPAPRGPRAVFSEHADGPFENFAWEQSMPMVITSPGVGSGQLDAFAGGIGETQSPQTRQVPGTLAPQPPEKKDPGLPPGGFQDATRERRSPFLRRPAPALKPGDPLPFNPRQYASVRAAFRGQNRFRQHVQTASTLTDVLSHGLAQYRINVPVRRLKVLTQRMLILYGNLINPGTLTVVGDDLEESQADQLSHFMSQQTELMAAISEMNIAAVEVLGFPNHEPPQPLPIELNQPYYVDEQLGRVRYSEVTDTLVDTSDLESWIDGAIDFNKFAANVNRYVQTGELPVMPNRARRGIYERTGGYLDNGYGAKVLGPIDQSTLRHNAPMRAGWGSVWSSYAAITLLDVDIAPRGEIPSVDDFC